MTRTGKITTVIAIISMGAAAFAAPVFAKDNVMHVSSSVVASNEDYLAVSVEAPAEAIAFFVAHGANAATIQLPLDQMPVKDRDAIRKIYSRNDDPDYRNEVNSIVYASIKKYLEPGKAETVTTSIGPCEWKVTYNGDSRYEDGSVFAAD